MQSPTVQPDSGRLCATCGAPLSYSGRGRRPVVHAGSCARTRASEVDADRRWARYGEVLSDASVRAPFIGAAHVDSDADGGDVGLLQRLGRAGFAPLFDDPREKRVQDRALVSHRREALASVRPMFAEERRKRQPKKAFGRVHPVTACFGCPLFDYVAVVAVVTPESLIRGRVDARQDALLRRHLNEPAALMARRPGV